MGKKKVWETMVFWAKQLILFVDFGTVDVPFAFCMIA